MARCRIVVWGPGEIGGAVIRAAAASDEFEVVGAYVYSPHKHCRDVGELVGIAPLGVTATRSRSAILALPADVVILTPQPKAVVEGIDHAVIALLESGKSVVTTLGYHNVAMPNWHNQAQTPTRMLRELSNTNGIARSASERYVMSALRRLTAIPAFDRFTDPVLSAAANRIAPPRATAERLAKACRVGRSVLHGTGVHPTFQVEHLLMRMAGALDDVTHVRFVEAFDFSLAPDGMWGGLESFGYGRDPRDIDDQWLLARMGDFYYGDLTGNVGHALYGAAPSEIRVEHSLRTRPAVADFHVGSTKIAKGTVAVMHMTHRGYLGDHHFFTNEEIWYLGADHAFRGADLPFGNWPHTIGGYTYEITGKPLSVRGQVTNAAPSGESLTEDNPITWISVRTLLDAALATDRLPAGVVIDDAATGYRTVEGPVVIASVPAPIRVAVWGSPDIVHRVRRRLAARPEIHLLDGVDGELTEVLGLTPDCVVVAPSGCSHTAGDVTDLLAAGVNVVDIAGEDAGEDALAQGASRGGATYYRASTGATFWIERILASQLRAMRSVQEVRYFEIGEDTGEPRTDPDYEVRCGDCCGGWRRGPNP